VWCKLECKLPGRTRNQARFPQPQPLDTPAPTLAFHGTLGAHPVRVLLDSGSECNFVSEAWVQQTETPVVPFDGAATLADGSTQVPVTRVLTPQMLSAGPPIGHRPYPSSQRGSVPQGDAAGAACLHRPRATCHHPPRQRSPGSGHPARLPGCLPHGASPRPAPTAAYGPHHPSGAWPPGTLQTPVPASSRRAR